MYYSGYVVLQNYRTIYCIIYDYLVLMNSYMTYSYKFMVLHYYLP